MIAEKNITNAQIYSIESALELTAETIGFMGLEDFSLLSSSFLAMGSLRAMFLCEKKTLAPIPITRADSISAPYSKNPKLREPKSDTPTALMIKAELGPLQKVSRCSSSEWLILLLW